MSISTGGANILIGFKKAQIYVSYEPKKCPFFLHNFAEHVCNKSVI